MPRKVWQLRKLPVEWIRPDGSSASGASVSSKRGWRDWRNGLVVGVRPAFPPSIVVAVKVLACQLPYERACRCRVSAFRRFTGKLCSAAGWLRQGIPCCGVGRTMNERAHGPTWLLGMFDEPNFMAAASGKAESGRSNGLSGKSCPKSPPNPPPGCSGSWTTVLRIVGRRAWSGRDRSGPPSRSSTRPSMPAGSIRSKSAFRFSSAKP